MIDPLTSLAFSVYSGKGVYALLLGSGISRSAEIPTGWEVTLDLIRKLAAIEGDNCEPDPALWYRQKFESDPDYSRLLENIAATPSERANVLASYFEATPEERQEGKKVPTSAHRSIARLAAKGYFRVIVTTNFDRLMEQALEAEGVNPTVISTSDMAHGAMPLVHAACTVIKVHGDYRDVRIKNTCTELAVYSAETNLLLDRIFDEYGLIICGWSATWDDALRAALCRCPNRRFSSFWGMRGAASAEAAELIRFRQISTIDITSADALFSSLEEKIESLEMFNRPHPLSIPLAVASLKRYLSEDRYRIELRDLVMNEIERQFQSISSLPVNIFVGNGQQHFLSQLEKSEACMEMLIALFANGCFFGLPSQTAIWREAVLRIAGLSTPQGGLEGVLKLRRYPACLLVYAGGIAAVASQNYAVLRVLLRETVTPSPLSYEYQYTELIRQIVPGLLIDSPLLNKDRVRTAGTPVSDRIHKLLREPLRLLISSDEAYDSAFDRFEYFFTLVWFEIETEKREDTPTWAPVGRFVFRNRGVGTIGSHVSDILTQESIKERANWPPVKGGLFETLEDFKLLNETYMKNVLSKISGRM